jgi:very-short-patch-repair endonuclease
MESVRVHLTVPGGSHPTYSAGIQLHRRARFRLEAPFAVDRNGLKVVRLEQAVIESWSLLPKLARRAPAIVAVRERRTTPRRLLHVLDEQPRTFGAREQRRLFELLDAGNHSELEIWGHANVFADKRLPRSVSQHRVQLGGRVMYLDRAFLPEMTAVELDGAAYHGSPGQRERDLRRDTTLARLGWLTVRFSHPRLHADPGGVVEEILEILTRRRSQLHASA